MKYLIEYYYDTYNEALPVCVVEGEDNATSMWAMLTRILISKMPVPEVKRDQMRKFFRSLGLPEDTNYSSACWFSMSPIREQKEFNIYEVCCLLYYG